MNYFHYEITGQSVQTCYPLSIARNTVKFSNNKYKINETSAMNFELTVKQFRYYNYFCGKLSFQEIANLIAKQYNYPVEQALKECKLDSRSG